MQQSEKVFWAIVGVSLTYLIAGFSFSLGAKVNAQTSQQTITQQAPAQPAANGMGCMAKGGGCGCGGMMKR